MSLGKPKPVRSGSSTGCRLHCSGKRRDLTDSDSERGTDLRQLENPSRAAEHLNNEMTRNFTFYSGAQLIQQLCWPTFSLFTKATPRRNHMYL